MEKDQQFREFCVGQVDRLGVFEGFRFVNAAAQKEYRKFFETRTRDTKKVEAVMDEAVKLGSMPNLFELSAICSDIYPSATSEPMLSEDEQRAHAEYRRKWYAQELESAQARRAAFLARNNPAITKEAAERLVGPSND